MRTADLGTQAALLAVPESGLRKRDVICIRARSLDGESAADFNLWNDLQAVTIQIARGDTGVLENRDCVGDGAILSIGPIKLTSDLTVQTLSIRLSQIHATVQDMIRGHDCRQARIEVYRVLFNPKTNGVVGAAQCHFFGKINTAKIATPRTNEEGGIDLDCVSHIRELTRTNPAKKSDETQKRRLGDRFRRYNGLKLKPLWGAG